jgi:hypothetical protein
MEIEHKVSISDLRQQCKMFAAQGDKHLAITIKEAADEITALRCEIVKLKGTIREIRSIANLSIMGRV